MARSPAPPAIAAVRSEPGRILIVVTHLLGVGHLSRAAAIGRALAREGHAVTLVSGGRPSPLVARDGLAFVQLPSVHCRGTDFRTLLDEAGRPVAAGLLAERRDLLLATFAAVRPEVVATELFPFGRRQLAEEFDALLAAARAARPRPFVLASVRDILNPPSRPARVDEALERLGRSYDRVLVHGDPELSRLWDSWPCSPALAARLVDTGYIAEARSQEAVPPDGDPVAEGEVIVSGGGSAAGLPLQRAALGAAALLSPPRAWRVLVGQGVDEAGFAALRDEAPPNATVERARPDFPDLLARACVSVSQCGYNTMVDLALARVRAVVVPFEAGNEAEQRVRAGRMAERGLAEVLSEAVLGPETLAAAVGKALASPRPGLAPLDLGGLARTATAIGEALRLARLRDLARARLDDALAAYGRAGKMLDLWWRDDDAVQDTPALRRLLGLARETGVPVALAVIPARLDPSLPAALAREPGIEVLQHGYAHADHAQPGEKKIELGGSSPLPLLTEELELGARRLGRAFGPRFRPVLVPPWNRIAPGLVPALPGLGYRGLSTFRPRRARDAAPGLVQVNTHWDPIAWRAGGGLREEAELWSELASGAEQRLAREIDADEPLGLLTHHLVHDGWIWRFLEEVLSLLGSHPSVRARTASQAFGL